MMKSDEHSTKRHLQTRGSSWHTGRRHWKSTVVTARSSSTKGTQRKLSTNHILIGPDSQLILSGSGIAVKGADWLYQVVITRQRLLRMDG